MPRRSLPGAFALAAVAVAALVLPATAAASVLPVTGNLVLAGTGDVRMGGNGAAIAPGDVNGDRLVDVALTFSTRTEIYLGGAGTAPLSPMSTDRLITVQHATGQREVPAGDLDGDGRDELLTLTCSPGRVSGDAVLRTLPAGPGVVRNTDVLSPRTRFTVPSNPAAICVRNAIAVGDLDADGFEDLIVEWSRPELETDLEFGMRRTVIFGATTLPAVIDLESPGALGYRLRGKAPGEPHYAVTPPGWEGSWSSAQGWDFADVKAAGDVNGDGKSDYALIRGDEAGPSYLYIVLGSASRTDLVMNARAGRAIRVGPVSSVGRIARLGDFSGDGLADLAVSLDAPLTSRVIRGRTATTDLGMSSAFQLINGELESGVPAGDLNGDGLGDAAVRLQPDAAVGSVPRSAVIFGRTATTAILVPVPGGTFATGLNLPAPALPLGGDWNGDGRPDLYLPGGGVTFGYGAGIPPEVTDTTPPVLTNFAVTRGVWYYCGFLGGTKTVMGAASYKLDEAATLQFSVVHRGATRTGSRIVPAGSTGVGPPNSLIAAANGPAVVTVTPVDASGNRGASSTVTIDVSQTSWDWTGCA